MSNDNTSKLKKNCRYSKSLKIYNPLPPDTHTHLFQALTHPQ